MGRWSDFRIRVPGKWVLCGEHSVLRGATALALPHPEFGLTLRFKERPSMDGLQIVTSEGADAVRDLIDAVIEREGDEERSVDRPRGELSIESTIPVGSGLGSSAALCVALTRWMSDPLRIDSDRFFEFARELENRFHGRSSGMDVAAVLHAKPIAYTMGRPPERIEVRKLPRFTFHDTGLRARTNECIFRVDRKREEDPTQALYTDDLMRKASRLCMEGLSLYDAGATNEGIQRLGQGVDLAFDAFLRWELVPAEAMRIREKLMREGARSARLTGAGGGGFVVALWPDGSIA